MYVITKFENGAVLAFRWGLQRSPISRLLLSNTLDATGSKLFDAIISLTVVLHLGFSATELGLLNFLGALSFLLLSVPIGHLVDRLGAGFTLFLSLLGKVVFVAAVALLFATGLLNTATTLLLVTVLGMLALLTETAQTSLAPLLVKGDAAISAAVARLAAADQVVSVVAPVGAGLLFAFSGGLNALLVSLVFAVISLIAALRLRRRVVAGEITAEDDGDDTPSASLGTGFKIIFSNRLLLATILLVAAANIGLAFGDTLLDILLLRHMGVHPVWFGALESLGAVAGIGGALIAPAVLARFKTKRIFSYGALAQSVIAVLPLLAYLIPVLSYPAMILLHASWAFVITITNIAGIAYAAQAIPKRALGRSFGARRMITMGCVPFAALAAGALADLTAMWVPLLVWPILTFLAVLAFSLLAGNGQDKSTVS